jgi:hypothetical protein
MFRFFILSETQRADEWTAQNEFACLTGGLPIA